jgi:AcrR family transcriptional regulator
MDAVAEWTGVSRKTIYNHFDGKNELMAELAMAGMDRIITGLRTIAMDASLGYTEKLDLIVERGFRESNELFVMRETGAHGLAPSDFHTSYQEVRKLLATLIEEMTLEAASRGLMRSDLDPKRFAYILINIIGGIVRFDDPESLPCTHLELLRESIRVLLCGSLSPLGEETLRDSRLLARGEA